MENGIVHSILYPVLEKILGTHQVRAGLYAEVYQGVELHVDNDVVLSNYPATSQSDKNLGK